MTALLRKAKSTMYSHFDDTVAKPPQPPPKDKVLHTTLESSSVEDKEWSRADISTGTECVISTELRLQLGQQSNKQRSIAELRRRLVRKASTFSLRNNSNKTHLKASTKQPGPQISILRKRTSDSNLAFDQNTIHPSAITDPQLNPSEATRSLRVSTNSADNSCVTAAGTAIVQTEESFGPTVDCEVLGVKREGPIQSQLEEGIYKKTKDGKKIRPASWRKMAAPTVEPPVSYEKLKQITTDACDTALSQVTKYNHSDTESWNTSIINTILAALVNETSSEFTVANGASSSPPQPSFKFVVNSTIIQHGATSTSEDGKTSGRRGMHSASGAYWNNEKDGMWSFKYEAAEAKGLDVVIGIIWIWVGQ